MNSCGASFAPGGLTFNSFSKSESLSAMFTGTGGTMVVSGYCVRSLELLTAFVIDRTQRLQADVLAHQ